jgi:hypothetical protein
MYGNENNFLITKVQKNGHIFEKASWRLSTNRSDLLLKITGRDGSKGIGTYPRDLKHNSSSALAGTAQISDQFRNTVYDYREERDWRYGTYPRDLEDNSPGALAGAAHVDVHVAVGLLLLQTAAIPLP